MPTSPQTMAGNLQITGTSVITGAATGGQQKENVQIGQNGFPTINPQVTQAAASGSTGQCTKHYQSQVVVAASGQSTVNLTGLTDGIGDSIAMTNIKMILVSIVSADGSKKLRVGPQGTANGWVGPFGTAATTSAFEDVRGTYFNECTLATTGWTAGAGAYVLPLQEVTGVTTTAQVLIWGN